MSAIEFYTETWRDVCDEYSTSLCWRRGDESGVMATLDDAPDDVLAAMLGALEVGQPPSLHAEALQAAGVDTADAMTDRELAKYLLDRMTRGRTALLPRRWHLGRLLPIHGSTVCSALLSAAGLDPDEVPQ